MGYGIHNLKFYYTTTANSVLLYVCESWAMRKSDRNIISGSFRKMKVYKRANRIRNDDVGDDDMKIFSIPEETCFFIYNNGKPFEKNGQYHHSTGSL